MTILQGETYRERLLLAELRDLPSVRKHCNLLWADASSDNLKHLVYSEDQLEATSDYVAKLIQANYPNLIIPLHSQLRDFSVQGIDRINILQHKVEPKAQSAKQLKSIFELVFISVLIGADVGSKWHYKDHLAAVTLNGSAGIAVANYNMFMQGMFSSDTENLYQVDNCGLQKITQQVLGSALQVSPLNQIIGIKERCNMLQQVAHSMQKHAEYFTDTDYNVRLGNIIDFWCKKIENNTLSIVNIFHSLQEIFSCIWQDADVWPYAALSNDLNPLGFIPLHTMLQWLCYSLYDLFTMYGYTIIDTEALTGLAEYRNGGLLIDQGVLKPRDAQMLNIIHAQTDEFVVEWRAMTIVVLDRLADQIRNILHLSSSELPMSKILQALTLRPVGSSPIRIATDGTLF